MVVIYIIPFQNLNVEINGSNHYYIRNIILLPEILACLQLVHVHKHAYNNNKAEIYRLFSAPQSQRLCTF